MIVCNSQNPCVSTCLSHTVLSKTQPPMQSIGSSSLRQWSPRNLGYSTNSHLGSCCLLTPLSIGPQPMLHIFNLYLLLIVKLMHFLCFLPRAGSLRGSPVGWGGGAISPAFFVLPDQCFQEEAIGLSKCSGYMCVCVYTHMPLDVFDLVSTTSSPGMAFSLWSVSTWTKDPQLWPWANPSYLSQNDQRV